MDELTSSLEARDSAKTQIRTLKLDVKSLDLPTHKSRRGCKTEETYRLASGSGVRRKRSGGFNAEGAHLSIVKT
jgi:hypothetical protein